MEDYLEGVIDDFPEDIIEEFETPEASNLFDVIDEDDKKLVIIDKRRSQVFHRTVAQ